MHEGTFGAAEGGPDVDDTATGPLPLGHRVEVRSRFDRSWARGFEIAEILPRGYRLRRLSDGAVLPADFSPDDVREERKQSVW